MPTFPRKTPRLRVVVKPIPTEDAQRAWDEQTQLRGLLEARGLEIDLDEVFDSSAYTAHAAAIVARLDDVVG